MGPIEAFTRTLLGDVSTNVGLSHEKARGGEVCTLRFGLLVNRFMKLVFSFCFSFLSVGFGAGVGEATVTLGGVMAVAAE